MKKWVYIFTILILSTNFWNLAFFTPISNSEFGKVILPLLLFIWGILYYPKKKNIYVTPYFTKIYILYSGLLFSVTSVILFHGQQPLQSILVYRNLVPILFFVVIFYIQPSIKGIKKAIYYAVLISYAFIILSLFIPSLFDVDLNALVEKAANIKESKSTDFLFVARGTGTISNIVLCWSLSNCVNKITRNDIIIILICYGMLILFQNRQNLIFATIIILYTLWKIRQAYATKWIIILALISIIILSFDIWNSLYYETISQMNNANYARNRSLPYFLFKHNPNFYCDIFGNGIDTKHSQYGQYLLYIGTYLNIWSTDLGLVGTWSVYGIIPIIFVYSLSIKILKHKTMPLFVKYMASASFLMPMLLGFSSSSPIYWWVFLYYFYAYYNSLSKKNINEKRCINYHNKLSNTATVY